MATTDKFKVGDIVIRTGCSNATVRTGLPYEISEVADSYHVQLKGHGTIWFRTDLFDLLAPLPAEDVPEANPLNVQVSGDHYKLLPIQPIEYIHANGIPFAEGCIIKYVSRWRAKGGLPDLEKARHFIDLLISLEKKAMK